MKSFLSLFFIFLFGVVSAQQVDDVDFKRLKADLDFKEAKQVSGFVFVYFKTLKDVDSVYLDAINMKFKSIELTNVTTDAVEASDFRIDADKIVILNNFKKDKDYLLSFWYSAEPKKAMYFVDDQIWTQGQGKYTSSWLPSIDDMNDKIEFDLSVSYEDGYAVLANGYLISKENITQNRTKWPLNQTSSMIPVSSLKVATKRLARP